jgi:hypothetical protein
LALTFYDLLIEALIDPDGGFRGQILDERNRLGYNSRTSVSQLRFLG